MSRRRTPAAHPIDPQLKTERHHLAALVVARSWQPGGPITPAGHNLRIRHQPQAPRRTWRHRRIGLLACSRGRGRRVRGDDGGVAAGRGRTAEDPSSAGALVWDPKGRLLILKPTYKSGWTIPGGVVEADGETPWEACRRETREECGLDLRHGRLLCVDFLRPRPGRPGGMRFLFGCGLLDDPALAGIVLRRRRSPLTGWPGSTARCGCSAGRCIAASWRRSPSRNGSGTSRTGGRFADHADTTAASSPHANGIHPPCHSLRMHDPALTVRSRRRHSASVPFSRSPNQNWSHEAQPAPSLFCGPSRLMSACRSRNLWRNGRFANARRLRPYPRRSARRRVPHRSRCSPRCRSMYSNAGPAARK